MRMYILKSSAGNQNNSSHPYSFLEFAKWNNVMKHTYFADKNCGSEQSAVIHLILCRIRTET